MTAWARQLTFSAAAACFALVLGAQPAEARAHHHTKHHHARHVSKGSAIVKVAQRHLSNLGYYNGSIDGLMGPATKRAIKQFQREHELKADGVLGKKTNAALARADKPQPVVGQGTFRTHDSIAAAPSDTTVNPDFTPPGGRGVTTRFGNVDVAESGSGSDKRYDVSVNGQPVLVADGQPTVVGVSQAYMLTNEDAVIFTTYSPGDGSCMYKNHVLVLGGSGTKMLDIGNCTRAYEASVDEGALYITFPEHDDNRDLGSTWKLEGENLHKL
ncbi:MAG: peptidoglycan-binding domain-containing protein [Alphaproteobacteria bacterium]|nr:peptidoglycan-binding domain-containing protein [Alphaproteobacteria bacterium]